MRITGQNIIGHELSGSGSVSFRAINPSTNLPLEIEFKQANSIEINRAVEKAEAVFSLYRNRSYEERALFLEAIAEEILKLGDPIIERCHAETALPVARITGEIGRTVNQLKLFANVLRAGSWMDARIDTAIPNRMPAPKPDIRMFYIPLGPVGVFGASNFPLAFSVAGGDTASALAAGCPVVFKAHRLHPGTAELVGHCIIQAALRTGMPDGVFSLLHGKSTDVGMAIVMHPKIMAIGFTGSFRGGKAMFDAANTREIPIPVFAEMGSLNPVFILPGALKERKEIIARNLVDSFNLGVGQFCTNPGVFFTDSSPESEQMMEQMKTIVDGLKPGIMLSEDIRNNYFAGMKELSRIKGVKDFAGSVSSYYGNQVPTKIYSTDGRTFLNNKELSEEVFGPLTIGVRTKNKQELIEIARKLAGHLTATIHGTEQDLKDYAELIGILELKAGRVIFNGFPTGVEVCHSMVHGGPYPSTTFSQHTSVGSAAIKRFSRPVCYQDFPQSTLPDPLKDSNPLKIWRMVNGQLTKEPL
jgi:2,5-dioxopentanoate dehydrogenase